MRAIASSTACSGLMPSATTRWTALPQTFSLPYPIRPPFVVPHVHHRAGAAGSGSAWPRACGADRSGRARTAARPACASAADSGRRRRSASGPASLPRRGTGQSRRPARVPAGLEDHRTCDEPLDDERLAIGTIWPVDRDGIPVVVVGSRRAKRAGIESVAFGVITTVCARNALLLSMLVQLVDSGGVQPLRQIAV